VRTTSLPIHVDHFKMVLIPGIVQVELEFGNVDFCGGRKSSPLSIHLYTYIKYSASHRSCEAVH
jgi:hypothetical protein